MSNYTMYETLMNLPLFRGANQEQVSSFIEKTHLDFKIYNPGQPLAREEEKCRTLRGLISGRVSFRHKLFKGRIILTEEREAPTFLAPERLFGLDNTFGFDATALTRSGTIEISKAQYLDLLKKNQVFLLNYLNYLSREAQKNFDVMRFSEVGTTRVLLSWMLQLATTKQSQNIIIETPKYPIIEFFKSIVAQRDNDIEELAAERSLFLETPHRLHILNRGYILDA